MKRLIRDLLTSLVPTPLKKLLFNSWVDHDVRFWLHARQLVHHPYDLYRPRFHWEDLEGSLKLLRKRFGNVDIYLLSDRLDHPPGSTYRLDFVHAPEKLLALDHSQTVVMCAYESDEKLLRTLRLIQSKPGIYYYFPARTFPTARYFHRNDAAWDILRGECDAQRGKFDLGDYENILQVLDITRTLAGDYVEIGVYQGGSAAVALKYMRQTGIRRKSFFLDLFEGMSTPETFKSQDASWTGTHADTSVQRVQKLLSGCGDNFEVRKCDIITGSLPPEITQIAVCNIDVDLREATRAGLDKCAPLVVPGGIMICEDQGHTPFVAGAYLAVVEFLESPAGKSFVPIHLPTGQMLFVKR